MTEYKNIESMNEIYAILAALEKIISRHIGCRVFLNIQTYSRDIEKDEMLQMLIKVVCTIYGVSWNDIKSKSREITNVDARCTFAYLARKNLHLSLMKIASLIARDHTSVIYFIRKATDFIDVHDDASIKILQCDEKFFELKKQMKGI